MRGGFPSSDWTSKTLGLTFRVAPGPGELPQISTTPQSVWTPPGPVLVRGLALHEDPSDPVVGTGAANIRLGTGTTYPNPAAYRVLVQAPIGDLNSGILAGWDGVQGPWFDSGVNAPSSILLAPENAGRANHDDRDLVIATNGGTAVGKVFVYFEYRKMYWQ